jgi:hypothetical protein
MTDPDDHQPTPAFSPDIEAWMWAELRNGLDNHQLEVIAPTTDGEPSLD